MVTIKPEVVAAHAQHVHLYATQLKAAEQHASHDALLTGVALGIVGNIIALPIDFTLKSFSDTMGALADRGDDVKKRIDHTAEVFRFTEQANVELMDTTKNQVQDPDLFHAPRSINDFPDAGIVNDIGSFASNCPQYNDAGGVALALGISSLALDVLGFVLDPVGNVFGQLAGIILDLVWPLKKVLDLLAGDPGGLQDSSTAFQQIATLLSDTSHTFAASLSEITPDVWDQPGSSDRYLQVAQNLIQLGIGAGDQSIGLSGDILTIGSFLGDLRAGVFDHIVGLVVEMAITAATGIAFSVPTFGASIATAIGIMEGEAAFTAASIAMQVAAATMRMAAASEVATKQAADYDKLVADIKR